MCLHYINHYAASHKLNTPICLSVVLLECIIVSGSNINDIHSITCQLRSVWLTPTGTS